MTQVFLKWTRRSLPRALHDLVEFSGSREYLTMAGKRRASLQRVAAKAHDVAWGGVSHHGWGPSDPSVG